MSELVIRPAAIAEAPIIAAHRRAMFEDMGYRDREQLDWMEARFREWVVDRLARGEYVGWFVIGPEGAVVAGVGVWVMDWPPHIVDRDGRRANVLNVYTHPAYRRRGLARRLMGVALDWCRAQGIRTVILHTSDEGRLLYESLGFKATREMRLKLPE